MKLFAQALLVGTLLTLGSAMVLMTVPQIAYAIDEDSKVAACEGLGAAGQDCGQGAGEQVDGLIATIVNILSWVVGVTAVIMVIVGGLKYVLSGGDSNSISSAKNTILYAIIGLAIAILAQGIVKFVLKETVTTQSATGNTQQD